MKPSYTDRTGLDWVGKGTPLPQRGSRSFRTLEPEMRALASEAYALWRDLAVKRANPYGDHTGCLLAGRMAVAATQWEDGLVILAAIRQRMDHESSPRWIPEWARSVGSVKRKRDHDASMAAELAMWTDIDLEARRVMIGVGRAKAAGRPISLDDVTCVQCKQFTETKCPGCRRPLHARACIAIHECAS